MAYYEKERTEKYRWHSKKELDNYFIIKYELDRLQIDTEIKKAWEHIEERKKQPISLEQLWQKVGISIEKKYKWSSIKSFSTYFKQNYNLKPSIIKNKINELKEPINTEQLKQIGTSLEKELKKYKAVLTEEQ